MGRTREEHAVSQADTAALTGATGTVAAQEETPQPPKAAAPFLSEGLRSDLETIGFAVDPITGARFEADPETGEVTVKLKGAPDPATGEPAPATAEPAGFTVTPPPVQPSSPQASTPAGTDGQDAAGQDTAGDTGSAGG